MPDTPAHTLRTFGHALNELRSNVLTMASLTEQNLENAFKGLTSGNIELCNEAIATDEEVNQYEVLIDREGFEILMRFNPVATDLRLVLSGMKVAANLERVSDQAENIAKRARKSLKQAQVPETRMLEPLYEVAIGMLRDSMRAFAEGNIDISLSVKTRDKELDAAHKRAIKELTAIIEAEPAHVKIYLHLIFIIRSLERIGDHSVNICEDTVFMESAADIRHMTVESAVNRL